MPLPEDGPAPGARRWEEEDLAAPTLELAPALLGSWLVRELDGDRLVGRIVETEAYTGEGDPASHAHRGQTFRNRSMFGPPGRAYVYRIYGLHWCINVVTEPAGRGAAVLVRALEPVVGLARMAALRGTARWLASGPGRLCQALGIDGTFDGCDLTRPGPLTLWRPATPPPPDAIARGPRVGIRVATDLPWRYFLAGHPDVSRGPRLPGAGDGRAL
jgi:DNA-3-methyladenine glycosylase